MKNVTNGMTVVNNSLHAFSDLTPMAVSLSSQVPFLLVLDVTKLAIYLPESKWSQSVFC